MIDPRACEATLDLQVDAWPPKPAKMDITRSERTDLEVAERILDHNVSEHIHRHDIRAGAADIADVVRAGLVVDAIDAVFVTLLQEAAPGKKEVHRVDDAGDRVVGQHGRGDGPGLEGRHAINQHLIHGWIKCHRVGADRVRHADAERDGGIRAEDIDGIDKPIVKMNRRQGLSGPTDDLHCTIIGIGFPASVCVDRRPELELMKGADTVVDPNYRAVNISILRSGVVRAQNLRSAPPVEVAAHFHCANGWVKQAQEDLRAHIHLEGDIISGNGSIWRIVEIHNRQGLGGT